MTRSAELRAIKETFDDGFNSGLEAAEKACQAQIQVFLSDEYALNQPFSSIGERLACQSCASAIRAMKRPTP